MITGTTTYDHHGTDFELTIDVEMTRSGIRTFKREINRIIDKANQGRYALTCEGINEIIDEHKPVNCNHHMQQCKRQDDPYLELAMYLKAAISSTAKYGNHRDISINLLAC